MVAERRARRCPPVQGRAGPPPRDAGKGPGRPGARGGTYTACSVPSASSASASPVASAWAGEGGEEAGEGVGVRSSHDLPHPRAWVLRGRVGRRHRPRMPATRVWEARGRLEPRWTVRRGGGRRSHGAEHSQPPSTPGLDLPTPPPGPPCRPTGPSSRALLLAGIRRASSKFLLTLAAPVSLPAAGSVLGGGKDGCHL